MDREGWVTPAEGAIEKLRDLRRWLLNRVWMQGGCEAVEEVLEEERRLEEGDSCSD